MNLIGFIEDRIVLPGDSEIRRSQKIISILLIFGGCVITLFSMVTNLLGGVPAVGYIYAVWILFVFSSGIFLFIMPRAWLPVMSTILLAILPLTLAIHTFSGGFQGGLLSIMWLIQIPLGAALIIGARFTVAAVAVYILGVILAITLEPLAQTVGPSLSQSARWQILAGNLVFLGIMAAGAVLYLIQQVDYYRRRADRLLLNILPAPIAARLKEQEKTIAQGYEGVTVLFADIVGSTPLFSDLDPAEVVSWLNEIFTVIDQLVEKYGLEKIRTIGDNYMVASGVPVQRSDHAQVMATFALEMVDRLNKLPPRDGRHLTFRVGINSGPLVAGVIGRSKFQYDLWGDTVNIASRMESHGLPGKVHITGATYELVKDEFDCESRGLISVKGKGQMETWFLNGRKSAS